MDRIVLMYHCVYRNDIQESGFLNDSAFMYKIDAQLFEEEVKNIVEYCKISNKLFDSIELTFDDGGVSFYTVVAPILEKYDLRGVFFITTKYINTPGFLTSSQIKDLHNRGHIIGSHSHSHPSDFADLTLEDIKREWRLSTQILQNILGRKIELASLPNGCYSKAIVEEAIDYGIKLLYTSKPTSKSYSFRDCSIIGRYVIHNKLEIRDVLAIITSKRKRFMLHIKWEVLSCIKVILGNYYTKIKILITGK